MKILIAISISVLLTLIFTQVSFADFFGFGEAATAIADATWKTIAINAIVSIRFVILMAITVFGLATITTKFLELGIRVTQDNKITVPERWLLAGAILTVLVSLSLLVPLGFYLITRLFS